MYNKSTPEIEIDIDIEKDIDIEIDIEKEKTDFFIKGFFYRIFSTPLARLLSLQLFDPYGGYFFWSRRCLNLKNKNWVQRSYFIFNNF